MIGILLPEVVRGDLHAFGFNPLDCFKTDMSRKSKPSETLWRCCLQWVLIIAFFAGAVYSIVVAASPEAFNDVLQNVEATWLYLIPALLMGISLPVYLITGCVAGTIKKKQHSTPKMTEMDHVVFAANPWETAKDLCGFGDENTGMVNFLLGLKLIFQLGFIGAIIAGIVFLCMASAGPPEWMNDLSAIGGIHGLSSILVCGGTTLWFLSGLKQLDPIPSSVSGRQRRLVECSPPVPTGRTPLGDLLRLCEQPMSL